MFGDTVNLGLTRIHRGKYAFWQPDDTAMSPDGQVYFPAPIYQDDFSVNAGDMSFLIHELTHVWQVQSGIWLKFRRLLQGGLYDYGRIGQARDIGTYTLEQQASIVADWYRVRHRLSPQHGSGTSADYGAVVRRAIPASRR